MAFLGRMFVGIWLIYERVPASATFFEAFAAAIYQYGHFRPQYISMAIFGRNIYQNPLKSGRKMIQKRQFYDHFRAEVGIIISLGAAIQRCRVIL